MSYVGEYLPVPLKQSVSSLDPTVRRYHRIKMFPSLRDVQGSSLRDKAASAPDYSEYFSGRRTGTARRKLRKKRLPVREMLDLSRSQFHKINAVPEFHKSLVEDRLQQQREIKMREREWYRLHEEESLRTQKLLKQQRRKSIAEFKMRETAQQRGSASASRSQAGSPADMRRRSSSARLSSPSNSASFSPEQNTTNPATAVVPGSADAGATAAATTENRSRANTGSGSGDGRVDIDVEDADLFTTQSSLRELGSSTSQLPPTSTSGGDESLLHDESHHPDRAHNNSVPSGAADAASGGHSGSTSGLQQEAHLEESFHSLTSQADRQDMLVAAAAAEATAQAFGSDASGGRGKKKKPKRTALERARRKLARRAMFYDRNSDSAVLREFQGRELDLRELKQVLYRGLGLTFSKAELKALFKDVDLDDSKTVDGGEFYSYFFQAGYDMRLQAREKQRRRIQEQLMEKEAEVAERALERHAWEAAQTSDEYTDADLESAKAKLSLLAQTFDSTKVSDAIAIQGFDCVLEPHEFRMQLLKSFGIVLTPKEVGALVAHFDINGDGNVEGFEFTNLLSQLQREYRERIKKNWIESRRRREAVVGVYAPVGGTLLGR